MHRTKDRGGFTLVELVVVLCILGILAALLIPSLSGWVDKARQRRLVADCRACVEAAQTLASEEYALSRTASVPAADAVRQLAEVNGSVSDVTLSGAQVETLTYTDAGTGESMRYHRTPAPEYVFVDTSAALTPGEAAEQAAAELATVTGLPANTSVYSALPGRAGYGAVMAALPEELKEGLAGSVWMIYTGSNGTNGRIILYDGTPEEFAAATGYTVPVTVYDIRTGAVTRGNCYTGTATQNGTRHKILTTYVT